MIITNKIFPVIEKDISKLGIELNKFQQEILEAIFTNMMADPLYKSVSKISDIKEVATKHFLDSLAPLAFNYKFWKNENLKILDLGTGAGFPAFPLSVALEGCSVTALDSRKKSADFVSRIADKAGCKNIQGVHGRIEELGRNPKFREKFDLVVCRALAEVRILLEYCLPFAKKGGYVLFYKGPKLPEEISAASNALKTFEIGDGDCKTSKLSPPDFPFQRNFMLINKNFDISSKYPRKNGIPRAKPL